MKRLNVVNGILQSLNRLIGQDDKLGVTNKGSVQDVMLDNIRRIGLAVGGTRGNEGRIGFGLTFDPDGLTVTPGVGFTKSGNVIHLRKQLELDGNTGGFAVGDKVWLNIEKASIELSENDGGLLVESTSSEYTGEGISVVLDDDIKIGKSPSGYENILLGTVVSDGEGSPCNTFDKGMSWLSAPRGIAGETGDILKIKKLFAGDIIADSINITGEVDLSNISSDTIEVKDNLNSKGNTTLGNTTIGEDLTIKKTASIDGLLTANGGIKVSSAEGEDVALSTEGDVEVGGILNSAGQLIVDKDGFDVTGDSKIKGNLDITDGNVTISGSVKASSFIGIPATGPVGSIVMWALPSAPDGWIICNGNTYGTTGDNEKYKELADLLKGTFAPDSGYNNSTLYTPDFTSRVPVGFNSLVTADLFKIDVGETIGSKNVSLSLGEMPNHIHPMGDGHDNREADGNKSEAFYVNGDATTQGVDGHTKPTVDDMDDRSGANPHDNIQPSLGINFIIKYM